MPRAELWYASAVGQLKRLRDGATIGGEVSTGFRRTLEDMVYDSYGPALRTDGKFPTWGKHEATLGGVQSGWDWFHGARPGILPPFPNGIYDHHNVWGQVVPVAGGMSETRVRCQVDLPATWHLSGGVWTEVRTKAQAGGLEGGYWSTESFSKGPAWTSAQFRPEDSGGHSIDLKQTVDSAGKPLAYPIAHWFYKGYFPRIAIPTGGQVAIITRMRLISDFPDANLEAARFVGCFSGDLYENFDTAVGANGRNPAFSIQRHKYITADWKPFGVVTGTEADIRGYPAMPFLVTS